MYQIENSDYFYLFFLLPVLIVIFLIGTWHQKKRRNQFDVYLLKRLTLGYNTFKPILKVSLFLLGFCFLIISLSNPKIGLKLKTVKRQGVDIVFALDVSRSMLAEDIKPNRLEKAKQIIDKTIQQLGGDRVGIIIYAGSAYPLLPITTDHASAFLFLKEASPEMVSSQGTAISQAIQRASIYYDDNNANRFLVLLSDGENHQKIPPSIIHDLKAKNINTFTIGIGTKKGTPIPVQKKGSSIEYKKDREGKVVITHRNEQTLRKIASDVKGTYLDGNITQATVKKVIDVITNADKKAFETQKFSDYKDQFQWFIAFGLVCFLLEALTFKTDTKWLKKLNIFKT